MVRVFSKHCDILNQNIKSSIHKDKAYVEKEFVSNYTRDFETKYRDYLCFYEKYDEHKSGKITITTLDANDYCSYYIKDKDGAIDSSICNLPPFYEENIYLSPSKELCVYTTGTVEIKKSRIKNIIDALPDTVVTLIALLLVFIPALILLAIDGIGLITFNKDLAFILTITSLFLLFLSELYSKHNRLDKKRELFFKGYNAGYQDNISKTRVRNDIYLMEEYVLEYFSTATDYQKQELLDYISDKVNIEESSDNK